MKKEVKSAWGTAVLMVLSGGISSLAFAPVYFWGVLPITLSWLLGRLNREISFGKAFKIGGLFGFGLGICSLYWISYALMIDEGRFMALILPALIGIGLLFGLFWGLSGGLAVLFPIGYRRWLAFAAWVTLLEWVRSWFLSGFPWNLMGSVWENELGVLQSASVWGVYGLSFITILVFSAPALGIKKRIVWVGAIGLACIAAMGYWRLYDTPREDVFGVRLRIVQPNIPQTLKWQPEAADDSLTKLIRLSRTDNAKITHVIWPETAVPFLVNWHDDERLRLMSAVRQGGTLITGGMRAVNPEDRTVANSLFVLNDLAEIQYFYDKSHLVPFGEYVPLRGILPLDKIVPIQSDFVAGQGVRTIRIPKAPPAGPLICYEVIFSGQVANKKRRPEWLINVTNDGWYGMSAGPYQHLGMARMRAVEEGLPVVRAANTGISAVFDGCGRTIGTVALGTEGVLDTALPRALAPTTYARFGAGIPVGISLLILLFSVRWRK